MLKAFVLEGNLTQLTSGTGSPSVAEWIIVENIVQVPKPKTVILIIRVYVLDCRNVTYLWQRY